MAFTAYLKLFRLPFVFTAMADSATGYLMTSSAPQPRVLGLLALASAGLYLFGMAMNDVADHRRDRTLAPGRPIPSGKISLRGATTAAVLAGAAGALGVRLLEGKPGPIQGMFVAAFIGIMLYDFLVKIPPVMGSIRFFNFLMGVAVAGPLTGPAIALGLPTLLYGSSLTFVSTLEDGEGRKGLRWLGVSGMSIAALAPGVAGSPWGLLPGLVLAAWLFRWAAAPPEKKNVMLLVRDGVAGFLLLDAALLAAAGRPLQAAAVAALLLPAFGLVAIFRRLG